MDFLLPYLRKLNISELKDYQEEALKLMKADKDLCIVWPTGSGKSLVYQLAPFIQGGGKLFAFICWWLFWWLS